MEPVATGPNFGSKEDFDDGEFGEQTQLQDGREYRRLTTTTTGNEGSYSKLRLNNEGIWKISRFVITSVVFGTTAYFTIQRLSSLRFNEGLAVCVLFSGASTASYFNLLAPSDRTNSPKPLCCCLRPDKKNINEWITNWTYQIYFALSQVYLGVVPMQDRRLYSLPFMWGFGALLEKDIETLMTLESSDHSYSNLPPKKKI